MTLLQRFSLLAFLALAVLGLLFGRILSQAITANMLHRSADMVADFVRAEVQRELEPEDFLPPQTREEYDLLSRRMHHLYLGSAIERIKLWSRDGRVIWSDDFNEVGKSSPGDQSLRRALAGEVVSEVLSATEFREKYKAEIRVERLLELYVPVVLSGLGPGMVVVELYQRTGRLDEDLSRIAARTWTAALLFCLLLYLTLFTTFWRASRRLEKQTDEIRLSEEKHRGLVESLRDGIVSLDHCGRMLFSNRAAREMFGKQEAGRPFVQLLANGDQRRFVDVLRQLRQNPGEEVSPMEVQGIHGDGSLFPLELTLSSGPGQLTVALHDITNRRAMEDLLLAAKEDWEETFDIINDAITIHDAEYNILRANRAAEQLLGLRMEEILGRKCFISYHGTGCAPEGCPSCQTLQDGVSSVNEIYEPHLGKHLEIKALPRFEHEGGRIIGIIHVVRDIGDRVRAEEQVRSALQAARNILRSSPLGILVVDGGGRVEYVNPAMIRMGREEGFEFSGQNAVDDLPAIRLAGFGEKIRNVLAGSSFFEGAVSYAALPGKEPFIRNVTGVPLREGDQTKALLFVEDITDRERAIAERHSLEKQVLHMQRNEAIGRLASGVAHDFNNILAAILGYADLVLTELDAGSPLAADLRVIRESAERGAGLTRQLLAFSRKQVLEMMPLNLNGVIHNLVKMLRRLIGEDVELRIETDADIGMVMADAGQMEQVLMNLAVNARDAMPGGGTFTISTAEVEYAAGGQPPAGRYLSLSVRDTGTGMEPDVLRQIFDPFFTTKEVGKGTGLGLSTVQGIIRQHNGFIEVESEKGRGSEFRIFLPLCQEEVEVEGDSATGAAALPRGSETVLVAEDDGAIRDFVESLLGRLGYRVLMAENGRQALDRSRDYDGIIHLLLTDVVMPEVNGGELARCLKTERPGLRVVFVSGYTDDVLNQHGVLSEKGVAFLAKPVPARLLAEKIRQVLDAPAG